MNTSSTDNNMEITAVHYPAKVGSGAVVHYGHSVTMHRSTGNVTTVNVSCGANKRNNKRSRVSRMPAGTAVTCQRCLDMMTEQAAAAQAAKAEEAKAEEAKAEKAKAEADAAAKAHAALEHARRTAAAARKVARQTDPSRFAIEVNGQTVRLGKYCAGLYLLADPETGIVWEIVHNETREGYDHDHWRMSNEAEGTTDSYATLTDALAGLEAHLNSRSPEDIARHCRAAGLQAAFESRMEAKRNRALEEAARKRAEDAAARNLDRSARRLEAEAQAAAVIAEHHERQLALRDAAAADTRPEHGPELPTLQDVATLLPGSPEAKLATSQINIGTYERETGQSMPIALHGVVALRCFANHAERIARRRELAAALAGYAELRSYCRQVAGEDHAPLIFAAIADQNAAAGLVDDPVYHAELHAQYCARIDEHLAAEKALQAAREEFYARREAERVAGRRKGE